MSTFFSAARAASAVCTLAVSIYGLVVTGISSLGVGLLRALMFSWPRGDTRAEPSGASRALLRADNCASERGDAATSLIFFVISEEIRRRNEGRFWAERQNIA
jgi:hypothetical protein